MFRDFGFRGKTLAEMAGPCGQYLTCITVLLMIVRARFYWERHRLLKAHAA